MAEENSTLLLAGQPTVWTVQQAYDIYNAANDGDGLAHFIDVAEAVLETNISPLDRIRLLALLGTAVADPRETAAFYTQAEAQWQIAKLYQNQMEGENEAKMHDLRALIDQLGAVVQREHDAANMSDEDDGDNEDDNSGKDNESGMIEHLGVSAEPMPSRGVAIQPPFNGLDGAIDRPQPSRGADRLLAIRPSKSRGSLRSKTSISDLRKQHRDLSEIFVAGPTGGEVNKSKADGEQAQRDEHERELKTRMYEG